MRSNDAMRKAMARDIHRCGSKDPETIADYLLKNGWGPVPAPEVKIISQERVDLNITQEALRILRNGVPNTRGLKA